jgi:glucose-1-phosphate cytidylyltransferase
VPKPLLEVGDRPVLVHLMEIYAAQGFTDFVLAGGYLVDQIAELAKRLPATWSVDVVDTGVDTNTGGRVRQVAGLAGDTFLLTYADGLGNVDLHALIAHHRAHGRAATLTAVPLPSQYGTLEVDSAGRVQRFLEKPRLRDHLINAGFFVVDQRALALWPHPGEDLEREVLPALSSLGELVAFEHHGFWESLDTYKDAVELSRLCAQGPGPWLDQPGRWH